MKNNSDFLQRYARQIALPEIGLAGQKKLSSARILIIGVGGLGSAAGYYLAAAGVGLLGLVDDDTVDLSNLQRQIAHSTADLGRAKVDSAAERFSVLNPAITIRTYPERLTAANAGKLLADYSFIIDAADNFPAKFVIANACHVAGKPYSHAGIDQFAGQTLTVLPGQTCCYRCLFETPPPGDPAGVEPRGPLGAVPGVIGILQAMEAIKFIVGQGSLLTNRLLIYDALKTTFRTVEVKRNPQCTLCGLRRPQPNKSFRRDI